MHTVYLRESVDGQEKGQLAYFENYADAHQVVRQGKGIMVEAGSDIEQQIKEKVAKYRKDYREITESDDPVYKVDGAIEYYTEKLRAQLEKEVQVLSDQWKTMYAAMKAEADKDAANARRYIPEMERDAAKQHATKAAQALKYGNDPSVLEELVRLAPQMPNGQKLALLDELERIEAAANGKHGHLLKNLYSELSSVIDEDMAHIKIVNLLANRSVDYDYRVLKITHPTFKHLKLNVNNGHSAGPQLTGRGVN